MRVYPTSSIEVLVKSIFVIDKIFVVKLIGKYGMIKNYSEKEN